MHPTKLNIGSGSPKGIYKSSEWLNIDVADINGAKKIDIFNAPQEWNESFEEIHAIHMLEHVNRNKKSEFFSICHRILKTGGVLFVEVPDFEKIIELLVEALKVKDFNSIHKWTTSIYGKQRYEGDSHHWGYTKRLLVDLADTTKFSHISFPTEMISAHHEQEPVILLRVVK